MFNVNVISQRIINFKSPSQAHETLNLHHHCVTMSEKIYYITSE